MCAMVALCGAVMAQDDCFNPTMAEARKQEAKENYDRALQLYKEAQGCFDSRESGKAAAKKAAAACREKKEAAAKKSDADRKRKQEQDASERKRREEQAESELMFSVNGVDFKMILVKGGSFNMGCTSEQGDDCEDCERPVRNATINGYYFGETEVTQALWKAVMSSEPDEDGGWGGKYGRGDNYPAYKINYDDIKVFIGKLNQKTGRTFRLPSEAEWEYAARGGNKSKGFKYAGSNNIDEVAWYKANSGKKIHPVKGKKPNELGLYDMSGNVDELCDDYWSEKYNGWSSGFRIIRGGSWYGYFDNNKTCRVSYRGGIIPEARNNTTGFRLALEL